jgi:phenylpropionate dioxygenase-like ring-hydroxylating dioxygenase large terminal subunit
MVPQQEISPDDDPLADRTLPAWTYSDAEFFALERERIFTPSWQLVCHESEITKAGEWKTLGILDESIIVVRGRDQSLRAFANVCQHRGSRIVDEPYGCAKRFTCPYHAWTYDLDGRLIGVPEASSYAGLDKKKHGLAPIEIELWRGFIFIRLINHGGPSVAEMMAPYDAIIGPYRFEELRALERVTLRPREVNWKNIGDNYSDGLHVSTAHPGLSRMFGQTYGVESQQYVDRMWGQLADDSATGWSDRLYCQLLPLVPHLSERGQRSWIYFKLWPNIAFDIYPDQIDFMQWLPTGPETSLIREISYALPDETLPEESRRPMRAARYLNWRINRQVNAEDNVLISGVQKGMRSQCFSSGPLSDKEVCLRQFCRRIREVIPEARLEECPPTGWSVQSSGNKSAAPH